MSLYENAELMLNDLDTALKEARSSRDRLTGVAGRLSEETGKITSLATSVKESVEAVNQKQRSLETLHNSVDASTRKVLQENVEKTRELNKELRGAIGSELQQILQTIKTIEERIYEKQTTLFSQHHDFIARENAKMTEAIKEAMDKNTQHIMARLKKALITTALVLVLTLGIGAITLFGIDITSLKSFLGI